MSDLDINNIKEKTIDLFEIFSILWKKKTLILSFIILSGVVSVLYSLSLQDYYKSEALLVAVDSPNQPAIPSQFSGLASLTGVSLSSSGEDKAVLAIEMIRSKEFLRILLLNEGIQQGIFASEGFDKKTGLITYNNSVYNEENNTWSYKGNFKEDYKPSHITVYPTYIEHLHINKDRKTNIISLSYEHVSPLFSKQLLDLIIVLVNETARSKDKSESEHALEFLEDKLRNNTLIEMQKPLVTLMESDLQKLMLVDVRPEYLLKIIDKPFIPELKTRPNRPLICVMGTMLGALIAMIFVLLTHSYREETV